MATTAETVSSSTSEPNHPADLSPPPKLIDNHHNDDATIDLENDSAGGECTNLQTNATTTDPELDADKSIENDNDDDKKSIDLESPEPLALKIAEVPDVEEIDDNNELTIDEDRELVVDLEKIDQVDSADSNLAKIDVSKKVYISFCCSYLTENLLYVY